MNKRIKKKIQANKPAVENETPQVEYTWEEILEMSKEMLHAKLAKNMIEEMEAEQAAKEKEEREKAERRKERMDKWFGWMKRNKD